MKKSDNPKEEKSSVGEWVLDHLKASLVEG